jgi:hypothetical protein
MSLKKEPVKPPNSKTCVCVDQDKDQRLDSSLVKDWILVWSTQTPIGPIWHIPYAPCVDQTRIQSLIFVLVNLESSHALSQYLAPRTTTSEDDHRRRPTARNSPRQPVPTPFASP